MFHKVYPNSVVIRIRFMLPVYSKILQMCPCCLCSRGDHIDMYILVTFLISGYYIGTAITIHTSVFLKYYTVTVTLFAQMI